jgi:pheromone shutdown protein TraB
MFGVSIDRDVKITLHRFTDHFKGFEKVGAVREIFGHETEMILSDLKVEFYSGRRGYMGVNDQDGHMMVSAHYLRNGNERDLYLDVIHELVHVKQFMDGRELFENRWEYVDRPTEVEAYQHTVKEARRIGMSDEEICEYLKTEWMSDEDLHKLANSVGVEISSKQS